MRPEMNIEQYVSTIKCSKCGDLLSIWVNYTKYRMLCFGDNPAHCPSRPLATIEAELYLASGEGGWKLEYVYPGSRMPDTGMVKR